MKKYGLLFLACLFLFSMWVPATDATAKNVNALDIKWTKSTNVPLDKRWTISFNKEVHKDSDFVKYVYVENTAGEKIPVEVSINAARTKIYVEPIDAYAPGETYKLIINNGLLSASGKKLKDTVVKEFTTVGEKKESPFVVTYKLENASMNQPTVKVDKGAYYHLVYIGDDFTHGVANTDTSQEVKISPWSTLYVSYKTMNHQKPIDLTNKITPTIVEDPALNTAILQKGESAEITYVGEYLTNYTPLWVESEYENEFYLPLKKNTSNYQMNLVRPNATNKIGLEQGTYTVTNPNEEPLTLYAYNKPNVAIKKSKEALNNTYTLKPNEVVKISGNPEEGNSNYPDVYLENYGDGKSYSYEASYYGLNNNREFYNRFIVKKNNQKSRNNISIESPKDEYIYLKNTSTEKIFVYDDGNLRYQSINTEPLKKYTLQPGATFSINDKNATNLILENTKENKGLAYRLVEYNEYGGVDDIKDKTINQSQKSLYIDEHSELTNTSEQIITLYTAAQYVYIQEIDNKYIKKVIKPNEYLKVVYLDSDKSGYVYIKTSNEKGSYSIINNKKNGDIYVANKEDYLIENIIDYDEAGNEVYRYENLDYSYFSRDEDNYIHNTGQSDIQVYMETDLVEEVQIVTPPKFTIDEEVTYFLSPGEKWKVENVNTTMINSFEIKDENYNYVWDAVDFNIYNKDGSQGYTGGMGGETFFRGIIQNDGYMLIENTSTNRTVDLTISKLFMKISKQ